MRSRIALAGLIHVHFFAIKSGGLPPTARPCRQIAPTMPPIIAVMSARPSFWWRCSAHHSAMSSAHHSSGGAHPSFQWECPAHHSRRRCSSDHSSAAPAHFRRRPCPSFRVGGAPPTWRSAPPIIPGGGALRSFQWSARPSFREEMPCPSFREEAFRPSCRRDSD